MPLELILGWLEQEYYSVSSHNWDKTFFYNLKGALIGNSCDPAKSINQENMIYPCYSLF